MSSISNNRNQDRLRHLHGEGDRNYSAPGIGGADGSDAQQVQVGSDDPISVALHMDALDQNVVESNHKVSSAITFVQTQNEILSKYSNAFVKIAKLRDGSLPNSEATNRSSLLNSIQVTCRGLPKVDEARFNNEKLFNADPLRVSIYNNVPEPHVSAVDLARPDLSKDHQESRGMKESLFL